MNLAPLADAPLAIKIHLASVIPALAIGTWLIFFSTKGARRHRALGALYLALMTVTAVTTFFHPQHQSGASQPHPSTHSVDPVRGVRRAVECSARQHQGSSQRDAGALCRRVLDRGRVNAAAGSFAASRVLRITQGSIGNLSLLAFRS